MKKAFLPAALIILLAGCSGKRSSRAIAPGLPVVENWEELSSSPILFASSMEQACRMRDSIALDTVTVFIKYVGTKPAALPENSVFLRR